jgi:hypothetical protein
MTAMVRAAIQAGKPFEFKQTCQTQLDRKRQDTRIDPAIGHHSAREAR